MQPNKGVLFVFFVLVPREMPPMPWTDPDPLIGAVTKRKG